jgi:hypothetical protein
MQENGEKGENGLLNASTSPLSQPYQTLAVHDKLDDSVVAEMNEQSGDEETKGQRGGQAGQGQAGDRRRKRLEPDSLLWALGSPEWEQSGSLASATSSLLRVCVCKNTKS